MSELGDAIQDCYAVLLNQGYQQTVFSPLGTMKKEGRSLIATCPFCHGKRFSIALDKPVFHCWNCDESGDWLAYQQKAAGVDFWEAAEQLSRAAGVPLPQQNEAQAKRYVSRRRRSDLMGVAHGQFEAALWREEGAAVLAYLHQRGYTDEDVRTMRLGAYVDRDRLREQLVAAGFNQTEIDECGLWLRLNNSKNGQGLGETHSLAIPYTDRAGRPSGFQFRCLVDGETVKQNGWQKYLNSKGLRKGESLYGLAQARGAKEIIVTESPLAVGYLQSRGVSRPVVAIAGKNLSQDQVKAIEQSGATLLILALDQDQAGQEATEKLIFDWNGRARLLVANWERKRAKAIDDLAIAEGMDAAETAINRALSVGRWYAWYIVSKHNFHTDEQELQLERIFYSAAEAYLTLDDPLDKQQLVKTLATYLDVSVDDIIIRIVNIEKERQAEKSVRQLQTLLNRARVVADEDGVFAAEQTLESGLMLLKGERGVSLPSPYLLDDLLHDINHTPDALCTGFETLDPYIKIPRGGVSVLAALSGHGKTTMMLNLLVNMLEQYPEQRFYFYTYEEPARAIALKLIMIWSGKQLHPTQNYEAHINYLKHHRGENPAIERAVGCYEKFSRSGKLTISDKMLKDDDLAATLGAIGRGGDVGAVFIDYIQTIPASRPKGARYLEVQNTARLLREQAVAHNLAIVTGAQLNRSAGAEEFITLAHLRESGDIGHEAALVLGLYSKVGEGKDDVSGEFPAMRVDVPKQRGGVAGISKHLAFQRPILKVTDRETIRSIY